MGFHFCSSQKTFPHVQATGPLTCFFSPPSGITLLVNVWHYRESSALKVLALSCLARALSKEKNFSSSQAGYITPFHTDLARSACQLVLVSTKQGYSFQLLMDVCTVLFWKCKRYWWCASLKEKYSPFGTEKKKRKIISVIPWCSCVVITSQKWGLRENDMP